MAYQGYGYGEDSQQSEEDREEARLAGMGKPGQDMPELVEQLMRQKQAGAELTGMDAQLMRAAKLRNTPYNDKGQFKQGGMGAAMGAMASFLDRGRGQKEHGALTKEMDAARSEIARGEAQMAARGMQREDRMEEATNTQRGLVNARAASADERQEKLDARAVFEDTRDYERGVHEFDNPQAGTVKTPTAADRKHAALQKEDFPYMDKGGYGSEKVGNKYMEDYKGHIRAATAVNEVMTEIGDSEHEDSFFKAVDGVPFTRVQNAFAWAQKNGVSKGKIAGLASVLKGNGWSTTGEEQDELAAQLKEYNHMISKLELTFKGPFRRDLIGTAQTGGETGNFDIGIGINPAQSPEENMRALQTIVDMSSQQVKANTGRAGFDPYQFREIAQAGVKSGWEWNEGKNSMEYVGKGKARMPGWESAEAALEDVDDLSSMSLEQLRKLAHE